MYVSPEEHLFHSNEIDLKEIDIHKVWLLNNIHCLRGQAETLCKKKRENEPSPTVSYESGSLDTLMNTEHAVSVREVPNAATQ